MEKRAQYLLDGVDSEYSESLIEAVNNLTDTGLMDIGRVLTGSKAEDNIKISFLHTIIDQNWIMIQQLDQQNKGVQTLIKILCRVKNNAPYHVGKHGTGHTVRQVPSPGTQSVCTSIIADANSKCKGSAYGKKERTSTASSRSCHL